MSRRFVGAHSVDLWVLILDLLVLILDSFLGFLGSKTTVFLSNGSRSERQGVFPGDRFQHGFFRVGRDFSSRAQIFPSLTLPKPACSRFWAPGKTPSLSTDALSDTRTPQESPRPPRRPPQEGFENVHFLKMGAHRCADGLATGRGRCRGRWPGSASPRVHAVVSHVFGHEEGR